MVLAHLVLSFQCLKLFFMLSLLTNLPFIFMILMVKLFQINEDFRWGSARWIHWCLVLEDAHMRRVHRLKWQNQANLLQKHLLIHLPSDAERIRQKILRRSVR
ncbi:hypothetical protein K1719_005137 [Acacia pycnantha]|nr:hypothetical protein K1719_005137 [Acacia pycnantha]